MPPMIPGNFVSTQLRAVLATIAIISIVGALSPELVLFPFRNAFASARNPHVAAHAIRWMCIGGAAISAFACAAWPLIQKGLIAAVQSLAGWSNKVFWGVVCGTVLVLRIPILALLPPSPLRTDSLWYHNTAISIAHGYGLQEHGAPTAYRAPGYSALLAITYRLFGDDAKWAWLWGIIATAILLLTTYGIAEKLYSKPVARIATLAVAIYPALVIYTGLPLSDLVFTAGLMFVFFIAIRLPPYHWYVTIGVGIALGVLTLTRSVAVGLFLVIPLFWFLKRPDLRKVLLNFTLLLFSFIACLTPWLVRNYEVFGSPLLGTNMGLLLYMGNHPGASGSYDFGLPPADLMDSDRDLDEAQIDRTYLQAALEFMGSHPLSTIAIVPKKLIHFYLPEVSAAQTLFQDEPPRLKYLSYGITQIFYLPILILFALRVFNLRNPALQPRGIQWTGLMVVVYFTLMAALFIGEDRYRLPILPWMIVESSVIVAWLGKLAQERDCAVYSE
jgi:4-amino-4-deoxy-L-arabinose transferase-like glycosyltransferase